MKKTIFQKLSTNFPAKKLKTFFDETLSGKTLNQCKGLINKSTIIGAFDDKKLIGIARAVDDGVYGFLADIVVNKKYRHNGIGSKLVEMLCKELIKKNIKVIHCSTEKKLIPFFKKANKNFKYGSSDTTLYLMSYKK